LGNKLAAYCCTQIIDNDLAGVDVGKLEGVADSGEDVLGSRECLSLDGFEAWSFSAVISARSSSSAKASARVTNRVVSGSVRVRSSVVAHPVGLSGW
jgi:hypothetical protein